jgi:hypothetical protein
MTVRNKREGLWRGCLSNCVDKVGTIVEVIVNWRTCKMKKGVEKREGNKGETLSTSQS